ncbi:MAG: hypothetical protein JNJ71_01705 [Rubrivivax sp.]|nr:hypothetical protein [Rubrivivax sp.]
MFIFNRDMVNLGRRSARTGQGHTAPLARTALHRQRGGDPRPKPTSETRASPARNDAGPERRFSGERTAVAFCKICHVGSLCSLKSAKPAQVGSVDADTPVDSA